METFFKDYLERLETLHSEIETAILGLTPDALDWIPGKEMNSIAILVVHLTGAERYWIGDVPWVVSPSPVGSGMTSTKYIRYVSNTLSYEIIRPRR